MEGTVLTSTLAHHVAGCEPCEQGYFLSDPSQIYCSACEKGKSNVNVGSVSVDACVSCVAGTYENEEGSGRSDCILCPSGKSSTTVGASSHLECLNCPGENMFSVEGSSSCVCDKGYFMDDDVTVNGTVGKICKLCSKGAVCDEPGVTIEGLPIGPMYWRGSNRSAVLEDCIFDAACVGNLKNGTKNTSTTEYNTTESFCEVGYEGPLCAVCSSSYSAQGSGTTKTCELCDGDENLTIAIWAFVFFFILTVSVCSCCYREKATSTVKNAVSISEVASDNIDSKIDDSRVATTVTQLSKKFEDASSIWEKVQPGFKIVLSYLQVVGGFSIACDIQFPPVFSSSMEFMSGFVNFNFISLMPMGCIFPANYHRTLLGYTLVPIIFGSIAIAYYKFLGKGGNIATVELRNKIFSYFLLGTFLILPSMSIKIFSTFACK